MSYYNVSAWAVLDCILWCGVGWICYAEKTQPETVLHHISRTRSPQQIMGQLVNSVWAQVEDKQPQHVGTYLHYNYTNSLSKNKIQMKQNHERHSNQVNLGIECSVSTL